MNKILSMLAILVITLSLSDYEGYTIEKAGETETDSYVLLKSPDARENVGMIQRKDGNFVFIWEERISS